VAHLPDSEVTYFREARAALLEHERTTESVCWNGVCWKWTLEYHRGRNRGPFAVLIPNPDDVQLAVPIQPEFLEAIWQRRMRRAVRDGLELAAAPYDTEWGVWSLTSKAMLDEVLRIVREKLAWPDRANSA